MRLPYVPMTDVKIDLNDVKMALTFWKVFNITFVSIPGLKELADEIEASGRDITLDDQERIKYLVCLEISQSKHIAFAEPMFAAIRTECGEVVFDMDAYYPGRKWA